MPRPGTGWPLRERSDKTGGRLVAWSLQRRKGSSLVKKETLMLAVVGAVLLVAAGACVGGPMQPTPMPIPTATPWPTAAPEETVAPALTDTTRSYMEWLGDLHGTFQSASERLIDGWQESGATGPGQISADTIEEMEALAAAIQDHAQEVEAREEVPTAVAELHAALRKEVSHWETAAPLLVEGIKALDDGDEAGFRERSEQAVEEIEAAVEAREELLAAANELLEALQEDEGS
jgi:hypothetical protein